MLKASLGLEAKDLLFLLFPMHYFKTHCIESSKIDEIYS
jgi:hypothetical protein